MPAALVVGLSLLVACSSGDGPDSSGVQTTATGPVTASTELTGPADLYADFVPEQYAGTTNWICHPDLDGDVCDDIRSTVIDAQGNRTVDDAEPAPDPPIDCFYAYPTTSQDPGPVADLDVDESETDTVRAQVARYASVCRVFAPAYRQVTIAGIFGTASEADREVAYGDVLDAWKSYVQQQNDGRGVVLIGHSQGAGLLRQLVVDEIDDVPEARDLLVSAILLGTTVQVPDGAAVGGSFRNVPGCASADETGCVISYSTYRADAPPPDNAIFGRVRIGPDGEQAGADSRALCVDPTDLLGDGPADSVIPTKITLLGNAAELPGVDTPFASLPDLLDVACRRDRAFDYLAVAPTGEPDERPLDRVLEERLGPTWGLHLFDGNVAQDDLIAVVARQARAYAG